MNEASGLKGNLKRADYAALAAIWALLLARCAIAGNGVMWLDELFSYRIVHDPSVSHSLAALGDQADGAPPVYYLLAKLWSGLATDGPLSLRLFSTLAFCVGFTILWMTLRRAVGFFPTAMAFVLMIGSNEVIAFESLNARFYGLLFALACLATFLGVRLCQSARPSPALLGMNILTNAVLVLCHPLGCFYSAAILVGVIVSDLLSNPARIRPLVVLSYFAGWAAILLWIRQFLRQADINSPHGWVRRPHWAALIDEWCSEIHPSYLVLFCLILGLGCLLARFRSAPSPPASLEAGQARRAYAAIALSLIGVTPAFWVISQALPGNSIFLGRYLLAPLIGWTILCALIIHYFLSRTSLRLSPISGGLCLLLALFVSRPFWERPVGDWFHKSPDPRIYLTGISDHAFGHEELPIVCPRSEDFLPREHYAQDPGRYYFLLDWKAATDRRAFPAAVMDFKILSAIKRHYPDAGNIVPASDFFRDHAAFLLQDVSQYHWPELYLKPGMYTITRLEPSSPLSYRHDGEWPLLLVQKKP